LFIRSSVFLVDNKTNGTPYAKHLHVFSEICTTSENLSSACSNILSTIMLILESNNHLTLTSSNPTDMCFLFNSSGKVFTISEPSSPKSSVLK